VEDPAHATGTDAEIDAAFDAAYRILRARIETFLALPLEISRTNPRRSRPNSERISGITVLNERNI